MQEREQTEQLHILQDLDPASLLHSIRAAVHHVDECGVVYADPQGFQSGLYSVKPNLNYCRYIDHTLQMKLV